MIAHLIDTALYGLVERVLEFRLVDIMLILPHANALGVNLYEFRQVHQSATYRDGTTHGDALVGEFLTCRR